MTIWLNRVYGIIVNSKRVRRIMKEAGLQSVVRKKKKFKKDQGAVYKYDNLFTNMTTCWQETFIRLAQTTKW